MKTNNEVYIVGKIRQYFKDLLYLFSFIHWDRIESQQGE
jgi:hypothetical protein